MAEISRKSGRRIIESIDTRKATKQEVYDFYKRFRSQEKRAGAAVAPLMKLNEVKKADLVQVLERMEQANFERRVEQKYKKLQKEILSAPPGQVASNQRLKQFEQNLRFQSQQGLIDIKKLMGGTLEKPFEVTEQPTAAAPSIAAPANLGGVAPVRETLTVTRYQGRIAHDLIKSWVDNGLIDNTDDYDDSDEIWEFMAESTQKDTEYDAFGRYYSGGAKVGTKKYYDAFKEFLADTRNFERAMAAKGVKLPDYGTQEYLDMFDAWIEEQLARPF